MWLPFLVAAALAAEPATPSPATPTPAPPPASSAPAPPPPSPAPARSPSLTPRATGLPDRFFAGVAPPHQSVVCEDGRCSVAAPLTWTPRDGAFAPVAPRSKGARTAATLGALLLASGSSDATGAGTDRISNAIIEAADGAPGPLAPDAALPATYGSFDYRRWAEMSQ